MPRRYRHFLVRGFKKVRGEWSLMALCYNFTRLLSILGFDGFIACLAKHYERAHLLLQRLASSTLLLYATAPKSAIFSLRFSSA